MKSKLRISPKLLRLSAYLTCVFLLLSLLAARALHAQVSEAALALGRELSGLGDLTAGGHSIELNGARLQHARSITPEPLDEVLDRLEAHCEEGGGPLSRELDRVAQQHARAFEEHFPEGAIRRGILSHRSDDSGVVLCLVTPADSPGKGLVEALQEFSQTSDLSRLGNVRYAYAEKLQNGATRVVTFWSDSALDLSKMFPTTGDAAGSDSRVLPRPEQARRTLSAAVQGMPYAVRTYASRRSPEDVKGFYQSWMKSQNWTFGAEAKGTLSYFRADGYQVFVSLLEQKGATYVTLTEAGRASAAPIEGVEVSVQ